MLDIKKILSRVAPVNPTGAETHQEGNFAALLEPGLRKIFYETYDEVPEEYSKIFHVKDSSKATETDYHLGAMSPWEEFGASIPTVVSGTTAMPSVKYATINAGQKVTYTHKEFAKGFIVERKFMDDEQYQVIAKMTKDLARAGRYKVEKDAISVLDNAFTVAGYDGKPLISNAHPLINASGKTCSNLVTGTFSDTSLETALQLGRAQVDEANKIIQLNFDTLVIPPSLEYEAKRVLQSTQKPGGNDNDVNVLHGRLKIIVNDFITSQTAWFIMDSKRHELNFFWRKRVEFKREKDFDTYTTKFAGYMRYSYGYSDFRGIIGSTGVAGA